MTPPVDFPDPIGPTMYTGDPAVCSGIPEPLLHQCATQNSRRDENQCLGFLPTIRGASYTDSSKSVKGHAHSIM